MAKTKKRTATKPKPHERGKKVTHRVNTIRGNGTPPASVEVAAEKVPIGEAMRRAVEELGEVVIDDTLAPQQMRELSECYEDVTRRRAAWAEKNEDAKVAKKSLESATDLLLEKVRMFTHPVALPLFDQAQREDDLDKSLGSAEAPATDASV